MEIEYKINHTLSTKQFIELLKDSTLGQRRPIEDKECMQGMLLNSNLTVSAWHKNKLIGVSRCLTDFHYVCYLSDLAVSKKYQRKGIGRELQDLTKMQLGARCKLVLMAAPDANKYYKLLGYQNNPRAWILNPD